MNEPWSRDRIDSTLAPWNTRGVCGASGWMHCTEIIQSERHVFELAYEHFELNDKDGAA